MKSHRLQLTAWKVCMDVCVRREKCGGCMPWDRLKKEKIEEKEEKLKAKGY